MNGCLDPNKVHPSVIKSAPYGSRGLITAFWSEPMYLCKKNIVMNADAQRREKKDLQVQKEDL